MTATGLAMALDPRAARVAWTPAVFFGACTLVLFWATLTGGRPGRPHVRPARGAASAPTAGTHVANVFAPEDLARRRPVWFARSELFLDTELQPSDQIRIARTLRDSRYDDATLLAILGDEVAPICGGNLLSVAGEWAGFDGEWLEQEIVMLPAASRVARTIGRMNAGLTRRAVGRDLAAVRAALARGCARIRSCSHALSRMAGPRNVSRHAASSRSSGETL